MDIEVLDEVEMEVRRFLRKLFEARVKIKKENKEGNSYFSSREVGAVKRAALDLKQELTKITK